MLMQLLIAVKNKTADGNPLCTELGNKKKFFVIKKQIHRCQVKNHWIIKFNYIHIK